LADYAIEFNQSSKSVAEAASMAVQNPRVAENLVNRLIEANVKTSAVQITDEKVVTKRITCTVDDLGGIDPKSDDFEDQFRQKAIELLAANGYTVDPNTFSLNEVSVSPDGYITASVTSRFTKTFKADSNVSSDEDGAMVEMPQDSDTIVNTDSAQELRAAKRKEILSRFAQVMPGMQAAPTMPAMPGTEMGAGLSALTTPMADITEEQDTDTDEIPEPGKKLPIGTICPACGSKNVDLANGKGHCNSCNTDMEITYQITLKPNSDSDIDKSANEDAEPAAEAAAPEAPAPDLSAPPAAPAMPAAPAAPAMPGMPATPGLGGGAMAGNSFPLMVRISYTQDPDVFISATSPDFDTKTAKLLPVGHICPSCGNREAKLVKDNRFCYNCGEVYIPRVHKASKDPKRVSVSIDKIV
jgi:ssDNA-binding Zn-finger/Zn-ribbon topoisomerase 1